jgi:hypothetical protein
MSNSHPGCNCAEGYLGPHCELREAAAVPYLNTNDPYLNRPADYVNNGGKSGFEITVVILSVLAIAFVTVFSVGRYIRRRKEENNAITGSLNWSHNYRDRPAEINIAPMHSDVYEQATEEAFSRSSRDPIAAHMGSTAARRAAAAAQLLQTEQSTDEVPDDLPEEPRIDIGPPIDEDGHVLHNVEIV